jgi:acyl carrier protein
MQLNKRVKTMSTTERLYKLISDHCAIPEVDIKPNHTLRGTYKFDSLELLELVMIVELEFDVEIPDEEANNIKTVGDLTEFVISRLSDDED